MGANETGSLPTTLVEILDTITDGFSVLDSEWRYVYINRAAERIGGKTRQEVEGKRIWEVYPEAVGTAFDHNFHRAVAEQVTVEFEEHFPPQGIWYSIRAFPSP